MSTNLMLRLWLTFAKVDKYIFTLSSKISC